MPSTISTAPGVWRAGSSNDASDVSVLLFDVLTVNVGSGVLSVEGLGGVEVRHLGMIWALGFRVYGDAQLTVYSHVLHMGFRV